MNKLEAIKMSDFTYMKLCGVSKDLKK